MTSLFLVLVLITAVTIAICIWPMAFGLRGKADVSQAGRSQQNLRAYRQRIKDVEEDSSLAAEEKERLVLELKLALAADEEQVVAEAHTPAGNEKNNILAAVVCVGLLLALPAYYYLHDQSGTQALFKMEKYAPEVLDVMLNEAQPSEDLQQHVTMRDVVMILQRYLQDSPADYRAWERLAVVYAELQMFEQAGTAVDQLIALKDDDPAVYLLKAKIMLGQSGGAYTEDTDRLLQAILALDPMNTGAHMLLGVSHLQAGDVEGAIFWWGSFLEKLPADSPLRSMLETSISKARESAKP